MKFRRSSHMLAALAFVDFGLAASLTWDAGNTNNSAAIDAVTGDWNTTAGNIVWNDGSIFNVIWNRMPTIPSNISANFNGVIQNSATASLILGGTNKTNAGTTTVNAGALLTTQAADPLNAKLTTPFDQGQCSTPIAQLANISQRSGRSLRIYPANGYILDDPEPAKLWIRD